MKKILTLISNNTDCNQFIRINFMLKANSGIRSSLYYHLGNYQMRNRLSSGQDPYSCNMPNSLSLLQSSSIGLALGQT